MCKWGRIKEILTIFSRENEKKNVFSDSRQVSTRSTSILRKLPPRSLLSLFHNRLKFFWSSILISLQLCFFTRYLPDLLTYKKHYFVETLAHEYDKGVSGLKTCIDCLFLASRRKLWKFEFSHLFVLNHISTSEKNPVTSQKTFWLTTLASQFGQKNNKIKLFTTSSWKRKIIHSAYLFLNLRHL
jgi:hypothetical protein